MIKQTIKEFDSKNAIQIWFVHSKKTFFYIVASFWHFLSLP